MFNFGKRLSALALLLVLAVPAVLSFNIQSNSMTCYSLSTQFQLTQAEVDATQGAVLVVSRSDNLDEPVLYNTSVRWTDFSRCCGTRNGFYYDNFTVTPGTNIYTMNRTMIDAANTSWLGEYQYYPDPATLFVWLFTDSANSTSAQEGRPLSVPGTNVTNVQTSGRQSIWCDLYLNLDGTYSGYYPGQSTDQEKAVNAAHKRRATIIGAVVGVVGGLLVIAALIGIFCWKRRSNRHRQSGKDVSPGISHSYYSTNAGAVSTSAQHARTTDNAIETFPGDDPASTKLPSKLSDPGTKIDAGVAPPSYSEASGSRR